MALTAQLLYPCPFDNCGEFYSNPASLGKHTSLAHRLEIPLVNLPNPVYFSNEQLRAFVRQYPCSSRSCSILCPNSQLYVQHRIKFHNGQEINPTEFCLIPALKLIPKPNLVLRQVNPRSSPPPSLFHCPECEKQIRGEMPMKRHAEKSHGIVRIVLSDLATSSSSSSKKGKKQKRDHSPKRGNGPPSPSPHPLPSPSQSSRRNLSRKAEKKISLFCCANEDALCDKCFGKWMKEIARESREVRNVLGKNIQNV